jgi:predicted HTH transcriptional regulator
VLAKFFRVAKLCESAGYGFDKMLQWEKQTGNKVLFESTIDKTKFTFMLDSTKINRENITENQSSITENNTESVKTLQKNITEKHTNITENLTENQKKIIECIKSNSRITSKELSEIVGIASVNIRYNLSKLKGKGIIRREGGDKGGKWIMINSIND